MRHLALHNENSSYSTIPIAEVGRREREVLSSQHHAMPGARTRCVESPCGALYPDVESMKSSMISVSLCVPCARHNPLS